MWKGKQVHLFLFFIVLALGHLSAQSVAVEGTVRDSAGATISGASVKLQSASYEAATTTDEHGHFSFAGVPARSGTLEIAQEGFRSVQQNWTAGTAANVSLDIVLQLAAVSETLTVSATRTELRLADTPGSTVLLSNTDLSSTPALRVDDVLRQVPGRVGGGALSRWPPSAAQTASADFPRAAFTKT